MTTTPQTLAERIQDMWRTVDYNPIATREVLVSELLARAADVHSGERVLDVAAGTGNTALAAARRGGRVTATDLVPTMLETASRRASVEGLDLHLKVADAQDLPFDDGSFDVVLSSFGAMYAPDQQRTADELVRVCRPGGRIGLVNWTPGGLTGRLQAALAANVLAPAGLTPPGAPPVLWGDEQHCRQLLGTRVTTLATTVRAHEFCASSAEAHVDFLLRHLPPWRAIYETLPPAGKQQMVSVAVAEHERSNRATDGTLIAGADYLELVATTI